MSGVNNKFTLCVLLIVIILLSSFTVFAQLQDVYLVAVLRDFPPLYVTDDSGMPDGFAIDILKNVAQTAGISVEYIQVDNWDEAAKLVSEGKADFVPAFGITESRKAEFLFSKAVETIPVSIFVRSENTEITRIEDLYSRKAAVMAGGAAENDIRSHHNEILMVSYDNIDSALVDLLSGEVDAFVFPQPVLMQKARAIKVEKQIKVVGEPLIELTRGFLMRKDDDILLAHINDAIDTYKSTDQYIKDLNRWYGEPDPFWTTERIALVALVSVLGATLIYVTLLLYLKRKHQVEMVASDKRLQWSEVRYQSVVTAANIGVWEYHSSNNFMQCSPQFYSMLGYVPVKLTAEPEDNFDETLIDLIHPADQPEVAKCFHEYLEKGSQGMFENTFRMKHQDGRWVWILSRGMTLRDEQGNLTDITVGAHIDISDRKRAEEVLQANEKLLEAKNMELEQLIYVTSHDLRSPLVNVDGFSRELEYSLKEISGALEKRVKHHTELEKMLWAELPDMEKSLERIRTSTRQMDGLLKSLLKLSQMGRASLQIATIDMNKLLRELSSSFAYRIEDGGIELTVEELPPCLGDVTQLAQVFSNLLDNAINYLDRSRPGKIRIHGAIEGGWAVYRVEDNGIGIGSNYHEKIFELFYRYNAKESKGEGIGLTAVRQALYRLGGEISVDSKPGEGSTFIVSLPQEL